MLLLLLAKKYQAQCYLLTEIILVFDGAREKTHPTSLLSRLCHQLYFLSNLSSMLCYIIWLIKPIGRYEYIWVDGIDSKTERCDIEIFWFSVDFSFHVFAPEVTWIMHSVFSNLLTFLTAGKKRRPFGCFVLFILVHSFLLFFLPYFQDPSTVHWRGVTVKVKVLS